MSDFEYLLSTIDKIKGVGKKTLSSFNKKKIFTIFDLLWHLPISKIETAEDTEIEDLQVGKIYNIKVKPIKYNFPRIRNLPNKVICEKNGVKVDCIFFNSYEGYIKKILLLTKHSPHFLSVGLIAIAEYSSFIIINNVRSDDNNKLFLFSGGSRISEKTTQQR